MAEPGRRAAVLGRPVAHSLSPVLHRAAYAALGLSWRYDAIECDEAGLGPLLAGAGPEWAGFSCTMPLKRTLLEVADEVGPVAAAVGAANTLLPRGGGWVADNTDVAGIVATVRAAGLTPASATVLGAGGTAQACLAALAELGVTGCTVLVRDPSRTAEAREAADRLGVSVRVGVLAADAAELGAELVVSTLPHGAADGVAGFGWRPGQAVLDVVYEPWPTRLAAAASAGGATALSGAAMLLHQAAAQVELMTGRGAPVDAMRAALRAARPAAGL